MSTFYTKMNNLFFRKKYSRMLGCMMIIGMILFGNVREAMATHIVGSDITYKCMGGGFFEITLVIYRKCDPGSSTLCGTSCGSPCTQTMQLLGADPACASATYGSIPLTLQSVRDVNLDLACPSAKNTCNNMNCVTAGTYTPGVERYEFKGIANIGSTSGIPPSCCNVRFTWSLCCRNSDIGTGSNDQNFYVDAIVNRCLSQTPCNSSPILTNDPFAIICGNENYVFNNGAVDPDLDSLSYTFTPALTGFGASVTYKPPFAFDKPMPWLGNADGVFPAGIHCDPLNGDIMFTPPNTGGLFSGVMAVEVKQWKLINGVMTVVGITRRDIQMYVRGDCLPNNPPRLTTNPPDENNVNVPKTNWQVCAGDQLCFTITAKDTDFNPPTISDTTYLSWNAALAGFGATFKPDYNPAKRSLPDSLGGGPREDRYQFCWTPDDSRASTTPYYFTVTGKDKRCPNPGRVTRAFSILVIGKADLRVNKSDLRCGKWAFSYTNLLPKFVPNFVQWQISRVPGDRDMAQNPYLYTNVTNPPPIQFSQGGRYFIRIRAVTPGPIGMPGCEKFILDSVDVDSVMTVQKRDTLVCLGNTVVLSASPKNGTPTFQYRWFNKIEDTLTAPINGNINTSNFAVTPAATRSYVVQISDLNRCKAYAEVKVDVKSLPVGTLPLSTRICDEDTFILNPGNNGGNIKKYLWNVGDTTQTLAMSDSGLFIVELTDTFGCKQSDSMMLYVNRKVVANAGPDKAVCAGSSVTLKGSGGQLYQWRNLSTNTIIRPKGYGDSIQVTPTNTAAPTRYELKAFLSYPDTAAKDKECANTDTIAVTVNALPKLQARPNPVGVCVTEASFYLPSFFVDNTQVPNQGGGVGVWSYPPDSTAIVAGSPPQILTKKLKNLPPKDTVAKFDNWVRFTYTGPANLGGCTTVDSSIMRIYGTPPTNAGPDVTRCDISGLYDITRLQKYSPTDAPLRQFEYWSGPGVDSSVVLGVKYFTFDPKRADVQLLPSKNTLTYIYGKDYSVQDPGIGPTCYKADDVLISVTKAPKVTASQNILVCQNEPTFLINSKTNAVIDPVVGTAPYWEPADALLKNTGVVNNSQSFNATGATNAIPIPVGSGTKVFVVYYKDTSTGCVVQTPINITVARVPRVDLVYDNVNADSPYVCLNTKNVEFKVYSTPAQTWNSSAVVNSGVVHSVTPSSGTAAFDQNPSNASLHSFNSNKVTPGVYWLKTQYTNNQSAGPGFAGCSATDSTRIVVQTPPEIGVAIPSPVCSYDNVAAVSLSKVPAGGYGFNWVVMGDGSYAGLSSNPSSYTLGAGDKLAGMVWIKASSAKDTSLKANTDQCALVADSQVLNVYPAPTAVIIPIDSEGCVPYTGNFAAGPTGVANADFNWSWSGVADPTKDSLISRTVTDYETVVKGKYTLGLTVNVMYGSTVCSATAVPKTLTTHAVPVALYTADPPYTTIAKPFFNFINQSTVEDGSTMSYIWNLGPGPDPKKPGDRIVTVANPTNIEYAADTAWQKVTLKAVTEYGCENEWVDSVKIEPDITVFIPNAFRPVSKDGTQNSTAPCLDGSLNCNKVFKVVADGHLSIEVFIYNRWGQLVFSSTSPNPEWDGTVQNKGVDYCPQDVYVYQVNATSFNGKAYKYSGSVTLLR